jgi:hypothetical protein
VRLALWAQSREATKGPLKVFPGISCFCALVAVSWTYVVILLLSPIFEACFFYTPPIILNFTVSDILFKSINIYEIFY